MKIEPDPTLWSRVNKIICDENAGVVLVTVIAGMCGILIKAGAASDEKEARAKLAAMIISPNSSNIGELLPQLQAEIKKLKQKERPTKGRGARN